MHNFKSWAHISVYYILLIGLQTVYFSISNTVCNNYESILRDHQPQFQTMNTGRVQAQMAIRERRWLHWDGASRVDPLILSAPTHTTLWHTYIVHIPWSQGCPYCYRLVLVLSSRISIIFPIISAVLSSSLMFSTKIISFVALGSVLCNAP